jgi:hypothetical protein
MPLTVDRLARMLARFAGENGVPNGISPGELCDGRDVRPMDVGRLLASRREELNRALKPFGYVVTSYADEGVGYGKRIGIDAVSR